MVYEVIKGYALARGVKWAFTRRVYVNNLAGVNMIIKQLYVEPIRQMLALLSLHWDDHEVHVATYRDLSESI